MTSRSPELEILKRGAVDLIEEAELARRMEAKRLTVKVGFDPSAPDIHLGHTVVIRKMKHFQDAGHRVVFVVGDFTGMIGDPSGRKSTRPQLTRAEIEANAATYARQAFRILDPGKLSPAQLAGLNRIEFFLETHGSTGVQPCIEEAVRTLLNLIVVFPVEDETHWTDKKGNVLPDAFLVPRGSTAKDFAFRVHTDLGKGFIRAINARTRMVVGHDYAVQDGDVIKIVARA